MNDQIPDFMPEGHLLDNEECGAIVEGLSLEIIVMSDFLISSERGATLIDTETGKCMVPVIRGRIQTCLKVLRKLSSTEAGYQHIVANLPDYADTLAANLRSIPSSLDVAMQISDALNSITQTEQSS